MSVDRPSLILLAPIQPAVTGNGLAMRSAALCTAAMTTHDVHLVVVPVSGVIESRLSDLPVVTTARSIPLTYQAGADALRELVGDRRWRERLGDLQVTPAVAPPAPPTLARRLVEELPLAHTTGVLACRLAMTPLALALAERLDVPLLIDVDDADAAYFDERGDAVSAEYWDRIGRTYLPQATLVLAASEEARRWVAHRYDVDRLTAVMPNAVQVPRWDSLRRPPGRGRLLFVGNLGYAPNAAGLRWFVDLVLPRLAHDITLDVVGGGGDAGMQRHPRITLHGWVHDLNGHYENADVVVAPIFSGSGTRIKVLEAFAHGRPVVATAKAVEGIEVTDGIHVRVADHPEAFAAMCQVVLDAGADDPMAQAAHQLVTSKHDLPSVTSEASLLISSAMIDAGSLPLVGKAD
jgi:glycosyltransferase involved in cell wall biosynthesis